MTSTDTRLATAGEGRAGGARPAAPGQTRHFLSARGALETAAVKTPPGAQASAQGVPPRSPRRLRLLSPILPPLSLPPFSLAPTPLDHFPAPRKPSAELRVRGACIALRVWLLGRWGQSRLGREGGWVRWVRERRRGPHPEFQSNLGAL